MLGKEGLAQAWVGYRGGHPVYRTGNMAYKPRGGSGKPWSGIEWWPLFLFLITMYWGHPCSLFQRSHLKSKSWPKIWHGNANDWVLGDTTLPSRHRRVILFHVHIAMKILMDDMPSPSFKYIVLSFVTQTSNFLPQDLGMEVGITWNIFLLFKLTESFHLSGILPVSFSFSYKDILQSFRELVSVVTVCTHILWQDLIVQLWLASISEVSSFYLLSGEVICGWH